MSTGTSWMSSGTGDPMDGRRRCTGTNRAGNRCGRAPAKGAKVCSFHGGKAPQVVRKAKERHVEERAQRTIERYGAVAEAVRDPLSALLLLAGEITRFKDYLAARVSDLSAESWRYRGEQAEQLRAEVALYERALDRTARVLGDINRLNLEERQVRIAEQHGEMFAEVFFRVLDRLGLTSEQYNRAAELMPRELRLLDGGAEREKT